MSPWIVVPLIPVVVSGLILSVSRLPWRVAIASALFGLIGALIFAGSYFLWAIGGIAFSTTATQWALGLNAANLVIGILAIRRLRGPELSPSQCDVPPPDEPSPG